jgi:hypothetical protein
MTDETTNSPSDPKAVASGDRRDVHYEPDRDQLVVAKTGEAPRAPLEPEEQSGAVDHDELSGQPPIGEVNMTPEGPSVWDARPPADDAEKSGNPTGH